MEGLSDLARVWKSQLGCYWIWNWCRTCKSKIRFISFGSTYIRVCQIDEQGVYTSALLASVFANMKSILPNATPRKVEDSLQVFSENNFLGLDFQVSHSNYVLVFGIWHLHSLLLNALILVVFKMTSKVRFWDCAHILRSFQNRVTNVL